MNTTMQIQGAMGHGPLRLANQLLSMGRDIRSMKLLMIVGGLMGFLIGLLFGLAQHSQWPTVVWRSSVAALAAGMLMRWWGRIWAQSLHQVYRERQAASEAEPVSPNVVRTKL